MIDIGSKVYASSLAEMLQKASNSGDVFSSGSVEDIIEKVLTIAMPLAGFAAIVLIIIASYNMMTSQGNPDKLRDAKEMITNAIIGLVFILLSASILVLISKVFNLDVVG